jgi:hypothetical protein
MMIFIEQIDPPPPPPTSTERSRAKVEALESEDRWVKNLIDGLAGVLREVRH